MNIFEDGGYNLVVWSYDQLGNGASQRRLCSTSSTKEKSGPHPHAEICIGWRGSEPKREKRKAINCVVPLHSLYHVPFLPAPVLKDVIEFVFPLVLPMVMCFSFP